MPAPSPSPAVLRKAAEIARDTGCAVKIDKATGDITILPPAQPKVQNERVPEQW